MVAGFSIRTIAMTLGRAPSTVSREIKRNGGQGCYRATQADQAAWDRAHRPKICKLAENRALARIVTERLQLQWSPTPREVVGWSLPRVGLQADWFQAGERDGDGWCRARAWRVGPSARGAPADPGAKARAGDMDSDSRVTSVFVCRASRQTRERDLFAAWS